MADLRNCRRCGRLFNYIGGNAICSTCKDEDEVDFQKVKKYLYDNPGASISEVASSLNISIEKIRKFLKEERLEIIGDEGLPVLECEKCQKPINTGRFCDACSRDLATGFSTVARDIEREHINSRNSGENDSIRLRYLSKNLDIPNKHKKGFRK